MSRLGQQLSSLSRVDTGILRVTREKLAHTFDVGTTIAIMSQLSYASAATNSAACRHGVLLFTMALRIVSSFRMQAVKASFFALPA